MALLGQGHGSTARWAFSLTAAAAIHLAVLLVRFSAVSGARRGACGPENTPVVLAVLEAPPPKLDSAPQAPAPYRPQPEPISDTVAALLPLSSDAPPPAAASHCSLLSVHKLAAIVASPLPATQRLVNAAATPDAALDAGPLAAGGGGADVGTGTGDGNSGPAAGESGFGSGIGIGSGEGSGDGTGSGHRGSGEGSGRGAGGAGSGHGGVSSATAPQTAAEPLRLAGKPVYPRACRQGLCRHGSPCEGCSEWRIHVSPEGGKPLKIECLKRMECELQNASIRKFFAEADFPRTGRGSVYVIPVRMFTRKE